MWVVVFFLSFFFLQPEQNVIKVGKHFHTLN